MKKHRAPLLQATYFLCVLSTLLLTALALGFPTLYFALSDRREFSRLQVETTGLDGQVYSPANTSQTVQMIVEGRYNPASSFSPDQLGDAKEQARLCLEEFAQGEAKMLASWFSALLLDHWDSFEVMFCTDLAGVAVYDNSVCTSQLRMVSFELVNDGPPVTTQYFTLIFDPQTLMLYSFSLDSLDYALVDFDEAMLEEALRGYLVQYLKLDPDNLQLEPEKAMDAYYSSYGPFLPPGGKYDYRFYFGPATVYWDGHILAVNQN